MIQLQLENRGSDLHFPDNGRYLYASGGNDNIIIRYSVLNNHLTPYDTIIIGNPWPEKISVAGLALDDRKNRLYAVTKENNSLYVIDTKSKKILSPSMLSVVKVIPACSLRITRYFISHAGAAIKLSCLIHVKQKITTSVTVGDNPNDMCITSDGRYLFVANANDNSVSVIDTKQTESD